MIPLAQSIHFSFGRRLPIVDTRTEHHVAEYVISYSACPLFLHHSLNHNNGISIPYSIRFGFLVAI
jgi:hypothetical protein